jgi:sarcosine oxidase
MIPGVAGEREDRYDAIVVGIGGIGSAALLHLARRGQRVLGIERFDLPHELGSSHGETRLIRLAYWEHPSYVPLLVRAYELWRELEREAGERLLWVTGSVDASPAEGRIFPGSLASCLEHGLAHEVLTARELAERFPAYGLPEATMAVLQADGGFLQPERCIGSHVSLALAAGAEVHTRERVLGWEPSGESVRVRTERGEYTAERLVLAGGAWMGGLMGLAPGLVVAQRQVVGWFQPLRPELFTPERFPVFNLEVPEGHFSGFPVFGIPGVKLALSDQLGEPGDADAVDRTPRADDETLLRSFAGRYFPGASGPALAMKACLFENTPDGHFIVDLHPDAPGVVCVGGGSGHGFKFCSVLGEIAADLALHGTTRHDIGLFRLGRFASP